VFLKFSSQLAILIAVFAVAEIYIPREEKLSKQYAFQVFVRLFKDNLARIFISVL